jgi:FixJ family two-component response regulator
MPGRSGLDLYEELVGRGVGMPVIFVTAYADVPMAIRALKSGAVEFIEKPFNRHTLLERIQRAIHEDINRRRYLADRAAIRARFQKLTEREREVLEMIKLGRPNKAIAAELEISSRAVEMRRASLMKKLGVRSLVELMRLSIENDGIAADQRDVS